MSVSSLARIPSELPAPDARSSVGNSARWSVIANRTVYFAHQSVGTGIVAGVERLASEHELPLRVLHAPEPATVSGPAFVHFLVGQKRDYASKNAAVLRLLESSTRAERPVIVLKYCYGDIKKASDASTMFDAYCDTVDTIQAAHPDVTVVHTTMPLTTAENGLKTRAKLLLGYPTEREAAVARHSYNEMVRWGFGAAEPVFDLAKVQAEQPSGKRAGFIAAGAAIDTLAIENTHDGHNLNARGQRAAAKELLDVLAVVIGDAA